MSKRKQSLSICYVLPKRDYFLHGYRGRVTHAIGVASGLSKNGIEVHVFSGPGLNNFTKAFGSSVTLHELTEGLKKKCIIGNIPWIRELIKKIEEFLIEKPDIKIVLIRYASSNVFIFLPLIRRFPKHIWIFEVNSFFAHQIPKTPSLIRQLILILEKRIISSADFIYVVSASMRDQLTSGQLVIPAWKVLVVPNAGQQGLTEICKKDFILQRGAPSGRKFAYLGIYQNYYEFAIVAEAFRKILNKWVDAEIHFFGYGGCEAKVRSIFESIPNVIFHGQYDLKNLISDGIFDENWVLLLPYKKLAITEVGCPIKMFEYMMLGLPIIASKVGQLPKILVEDDFAFYYEPGDSDSLAHSMDKACRSTKLLEMGDFAQQAFLSKHTWDKRMADFIDDVQRKMQSCNYKK